MARKTKAETPATGEDIRSLVRIGGDGQPNALRPARSQAEAIRFALEAERQIYQLTDEQMQHVAFAAVAVPSDVGFPDIRVEMPQSDAEIHDAFATCDKIYRENPRIHRTVNTHVDLQVSPIDHTADEDGEAVPKAVRAIYDAFRRNIAPQAVVRKAARGTVDLPMKPITLRRLEKELLLDLWRFGNAYPWHEWYERELPGGLVVELPFVTPLDPQHVFVDLDAFAVGVERYYWETGRASKDAINRTVERWADFIPRGQRGVLFKGSRKPLDSEFLTHLSYHKSRYRPYAVPPLLCLLQPGGLREQLAQMDFALANGTVGAVWLVRVGTDNIVVRNPRLIEAARDVFKDPKRTMFCVVPHWYDVKVIQPNVEGMGPEKYEQSNIETGHGLGLSLTGDPEVDAHLTVQMLDGFRQDGSLEYFQQLYDEIGERNNLAVVPTIRWTEPELRHDYATDDVAWERGVMSTTTYARRRGLDWRLERQRVQDEPEAESRVVPFSASDPNRQQESQQSGAANATEGKGKAGGTTR